MSHWHVTADGAECLWPLSFSTCFPLRSGYNSAVLSFRLRLQVEIRWQVHPSECIRGDLAQEAQEASEASLAAVKTICFNLIVKLLLVGVRGRGAGRRLWHLSIRRKLGAWYSSSCTQSHVSIWSLFLEGKKSPRSTVPCTIKKRERKEVLWELTSIN